MVIAIDGPAGSGKSTVSKILAERLGLLYIDTGAMYRALTLKAMRLKLNLEDEASLIKMACSTGIDLRDEGGALKVFLDGEDVSLVIRTPELTANVKYIARVAGVRREMVRLQRSIGKGQGAVVFPKADFKFYLDADPAERARRRHKELVAAGQRVTLEEITKDVTLRDESDMKRKAGALKKAKDAVVVDTTKLGIDQVVEKLLEYIKVK
jgi:cytidylate kinase